MVGVIIMQEYLMMLDEKLVYDKHEIIYDTIHIYCHTINEEKRKVHQYTEKIVKDLPFGQYKTKLHLKLKRYKNTDFVKKTITEELSFLNSTKRITLRLENRIYELLRENNFIGTERVLNNGIVDISDSTLLRLFKKNS